MNILVRAPVEGEALGPAKTELDCWGEGGNGGRLGRGTPIRKGRGEGDVSPGKGITLEMYIRNTQVNKKKEIHI